MLMRVLVKQGWKILTQLDNIWVRIVKAKYLKNDSNLFLKAKKCSSAFNAWKTILDKCELLKRGLTWIIGNENNINFWLDNSMNDSQLTNKVILDRVDHK